MHRSSSSTRVSDEFFSVSSSVLSSQNPNPTTTESDHLPILNPQSDVAKKQRYRLRSAENAVHLIPLMLVLSAIILWSFSGPVDMVNKSDSIVARDKTPIIEAVDTSLAVSRLRLNEEQGDRDPDYQALHSQDHKSIT